MKKVKLSEVKESLKNILNDEYTKFVYNPSELIKLGWDFDHIIDQYENKGLDYDTAKEMFEKECVVYIWVNIVDGNVHTTYEINTIKNHLSRIANGTAEETGDDEQTIQDIILLENI